MLAIDLVSVIFSPLIKLPCSSVSSQLWAVISDAIAEPAVSKTAKIKLLNISCILRLY